MNDTSSIDRANALLERLEKERQTPLPDGLGEKSGAEAPEWKVAVATDIMSINGDGNTGKVGYIRVRERKQPR